MKLNQWLAKRRLTRFEFAAMVHVHPVTVTKWISGVMQPRSTNMIAIHRATGGAVQPNDFMPSLAEPPRRAEAA